MANQPRQLPPQGTRLCNELTEDLKRDIIERYWHGSQPRLEYTKYATYFDHYQHMCRTLYLGIGKQADKLAVRTHEEVLLIVDHLWTYGQSDSDKTRALLRGILRERYFAGESDDRINGSIALALRLWLTMNIREESPTSPYNILCWDDVSPLPSFTKAQFNGPESKPDARTILSGITAVDLDRFSGISIDWTCELEKHLSYDRDRKILKVYRLEHVIQAHRTSKSGMIPVKLVEDTIASLHLLFPTWDQNTQKYLRKLGQGLFPETRIETRRPLYLADFYYWRDRLAELLHESQLPASTPKSNWLALRLLWNDHRNPHQWWTFWFAAAILILTIIFGFVTSIATCMQTSYAYQSLQLARAEAKCPTACA